MFSFLQYVHELFYRSDFRSICFCENIQKSRPLSKVLLSSYSTQLIEQLSKQQKHLPFLEDSEEVSSFSKSL